MNMRKLARGLGWFSIGLGVAEVVAPEKLSKALGIERRKGLVRLFGLREIAAGVGILAERRQGAWVWARVVGDALDLALLGSALRADNPKRLAAAVATANVLGITALDVLCASRLGTR